jgi:hypothetical protein
MDSPKFKSNRNDSFLQKLRNLILEPQIDPVEFNQDLLISYNRGFFEKFNNKETL